MYITVISSLNFTVVPVSLRGDQVRWEQDLHWLHERSNG